MKILLIFLVATCYCQVHLNEKPYSFDHMIEKTLKSVDLPEINLKELEKQDNEEKFLKIPQRFGAPINVNISLGHFSSQNLKNGEKLYRLKFNTRGAYSTNLIFSKFKLPRGGKLWVFSNHQFLGAFTHLNNKEHMKFATGLLLGESFIIEYLEPRNSSTILQLNQVTHGYKKMFKNSSGKCNVNAVNEEWNDQIRSVAAIMTDDGTRFCSGAMINNMKKDKRQLFLTAAHCGGDTSTWVLLFNYDREDKLNHTASGLKTLSRSSKTDFILAEVEEKIPSDYKVFLSGFTAKEIPENRISTSIHHPSGDIKKISFSTHPLESGTYREKDTHWKVPKWTVGTTEPGSSGSPLFNYRKQIIGQLTGGSASCHNTDGYDIYGKISRSWSMESINDRLMDYLDADRQGIEIDGMEL